MAWPEPTAAELAKMYGLHPDVLGVSGGIVGRPMEPEAELHRYKPVVRVEACGECGHETRVRLCKTCGALKPDHQHRQRRARKELARRKGKVESTCPVCAGSGSYTDPKGVNPFRSCTRCRGWGRVWRKAKR